jgi:hypothetical protein
MYTKQVNFGKRRVTFSGTHCRRSSRRVIRFADKSTKYDGFLYISFSCLPKIVLGQEERLRWLDIAYDHQAETYKHVELLFKPITQAHLTKIRWKLTRCSGLHLHLENLIDGSLKSNVAQDSKFYVISDELLIWMWRQAECVSVWRHIFNRPVHCRNWKCLSSKI